MPRRSFGGSGSFASSCAAAQAIDTAPIPQADTTQESGRGWLWAELMRRSFGLDMLACPRCGGRLRLIAVIEEAAVIDRILRHLGLPTEIPASPPARAPPLPFESGSRRRRRGETALDSCGSSAASPAPLASAATHRRGIVHCDLKPGNVMLTKDGVKLLDFGVARMRRVPSGPQPGSGGSTRSDDQVGAALLGTISYMAPEQFAGKEPDTRTDLFAFGALLFEMLTGRRAFDGSSPTAIVAAVLDHAPPPVSEYEPRAPRALDHLVRCCLAKDPDERWDSARLAADQLHEIGEQLAHPAPSGGVYVPEQRRRTRSWWPTVVACFGAAVLLATGSVWWNAPRPRPAALQRLDLSLGMDHQVHPRMSPALISPDGSRVLFSGEGPGGGRFLYVRELGQSDPVLLQGTADHLYPFFSPDGRWVAFFSGSSLYKVAVAGGAPIPLCDAALGAVRGASWGDDGTIVAALRTAGGLSRLPSSGGVPTVLTRLDPARHDVTHRWPQMLPGSRAVLFTAHTVASRYDDANIEVQSLETGERKTLQRGGYFGRYLASGHLAFVRHNTLFAAPMDMARLALTGPPVAVIDDVVADADIGRLEFSVPDTGTALCVTGTWQPPHLRAVWHDRLGRAEVLPAVPGGYADPRVSPRGDRIAMTVGEGTLTRRQVAILDPSRQEPLKLLSDAHDLSPLWTPDGEHIVFGSDRTGSVHNLYWRRADGSGAVARLTTSDHMQGACSFSPDGRRLAYLDLDPDTGWDIWTVALDLRDPDRPVPGTPEPLVRTSLNEGHAAFSPDGRWLAYTVGEGGTIEVYVRPAAAGAATRWQVSHGGGIHPLWSGGGRELVYQTPGRDFVRVPYAIHGDGFVAGQPQLWAGVRLMPGDGSYTWRNFDLTPGGDRLLTLEVPDPAPPSPPLNTTLFLNFFDHLRRRAPAR